MLVGYLSKKLLPTPEGPITDVYGAIYLVPIPYAL